MATPEDKKNWALELNEIYKKRINNLKGIENSERRSAEINEQIVNLKKLINEFEKERVKSGEDNLTQTGELRTELDKIIKSEREINTQLDKGIKFRQRTVDIAKHLVEQLKLGYNYLQEQDKIIKSTNLNLGMSGTKAVAMRNAFEQSAGYVTRLGGTITDIQSVMQGYADETGRARVMTEDMVKNITAIGKGTGLSIEQATRLGAQFELMGYDAKSTMDYVQGVVDTSERMGVNTTKVLKVVNDNFKKLNTYTFQQGVKGFAEMAMYAEKFRMDISQALNAVDVARSLEGAINLAAQLQVMGGEFAKTDPFEMLFLARNDPAKFTEKIADMTKGLVSFRKMSDGTFEKFISPADRDRIAAVAKSMGMEASKLTVIAERQAEIQRMRQQMRGMGLSNEQKKLVEGVALWDSKTGKFQVQLGDSMKNISELTESQANSFVKEQVMLEERAKQAMTFDETLKATIETLKATLLPILKGVNKVLIPVAKVADWMSTLAGTHGGWAKAGAILLAAGGAWKLASFGLNQAVKAFTKSGFGNVISKVSSGGLGSGGISGGGGITAGQPGSMFTKTGIIRKGGADLTRARGAASLQKGLGSGAVMAGAGVGIMLAAKGISELADSMSKLTPEQAKSLERIAITMAVTFPLSAIGIGLVAGAATTGAVGLLALGAAITLVGAGIYLASTGIGKMGTGLALLSESGGGAGKELIGVAGGISAITLALAAGGMIGMFAFNNSLNRMNRNSKGVEKIGAAFANIQAVLSGTKEDFIAVEEAITSISNANIKDGGLFTELSNLLKKPLQVEFTKSKVSLINDITLNLDGQKFMRKSYSTEIAVQKREGLQIGKPTDA